MEGTPAVRDSNSFSLELPYGLPWLDLQAFDLKQCPLSLVDSRLMRKYGVLPLFRRGRRLYLGIANPRSADAIADIGFSTGMSIEPVVMDGPSLEAAVKQLAHHRESEALGQACLREGAAVEPSLEAVTRSGLDAGIADSEEAPVVSLINSILRDAIRQKASDIHFEPYEHSYRIRFRIDGLLREIIRPPIRIAGRITSRIKILAQMDIAEKRKAQDGRIRFFLDGKRTVDFRVSSLPTLWGEKSVLRILDRSSAPMDIHELGMEEKQKKIYLEALGRKQGTIIITGPTGSGKTVSLYAGLALLNTTGRNISTAEDPVEINLEGINQVPIVRRGGMDFATALRALLRQDPDVLMVGEMRDGETAEMAIRAAQTGHLVLSTLHTNGALETVSRLQSLGVSPYNIATSVSLVIAQRLLRVLCSHCKERVRIPHQILAGAGFTDSQIEKGSFFRAVGCDNCHEGYRGRIGIYEVVPITAELCRIIMERGNSPALGRAAREAGFADLRQSALNKVARGVSSLEEANRVT